MFKHFRFLNIIICFLYSYHSDCVFGADSVDDTLKGTHLRNVKKTKALKQLNPIFNRILKTVNFSYLIVLAISAIFFIVARCVKSLKSRKIRRLSDKGSDCEDDDGETTQNNPNKNPTSTPSEGTTSQPLTSFNQHAPRGSPLTVLFGPWLNVNPLGLMQPSGTAQEEGKAERKKEDAHKESKPSNKDDELEFHLDHFACPGATGGSHEVTVKGHTGCDEETDFEVVEMGKSGSDVSQGKATGDNTSGEDEDEDFEIIN